MNRRCECSCPPPPPPHTHTHTHTHTLVICNRALFSIIQSNESKQRDGCSLAQEILPAAVSSCFLMDLLLNTTRRSVKLLPSLFVVRFLSRAILISRWKSAWRWNVRKWAFHLCSALTTVSVTVNEKPTKSLKFATLSPRQIEMAIQNNT